MTNKELVKNAQDFLRRTVGEEVKIHSGIVAPSPDHETRLEKDYKASGNRLKDNLIEGSPTRLYFTSREVPKVGKTNLYWQRITTGKEGTKSYREVWVLIEVEKSGAYNETALLRDRGNKIREGRIKPTNEIKALKEEIADLEKNAEKGFLSKEGKAELERLKTELAELQPANK